MKLLKKLTSIAGASSDESRIKKFLLKYITPKPQNPTIVNFEFILK